MNRLHSIDQELTSLFSGFQQIANEIDMPVICNLSDEETIAQQSYPGIYRIDVLTTGDTEDAASWIEAFRAEWEHDDYRKSFTPNLKKKRIAQHTSLPEWIPLYLGKSKKVGSRVLEHINIDLKKTTFALKLKARPSMAKRNFRLHALNLPVQNYDLVMPALEAALRNRFHPLIGKQ